MDTNVHKGAHKGMDTNVHNGAHIDMDTSVHKGAQIEQAYTNKYTDAWIQVYTMK